MNLVDYIKIQRLRWAGYVKRMNNVQLSKKILKIQVVANKSNGRPKTVVPHEKEESAI